MSSIAAGHVSVRWINFSKFIPQSQNHVPQTQRFSGRLITINSVLFGDEYTQKRKNIKRQKQNHSTVKLRKWAHGSSIFYAKNSLLRGVRLRWSAILNQAFSLRWEWGEWLNNQVGQRRKKREFCLRKFELWISLPKKKTTMSDRLEAYDLSKFKQNISLSTEHCLNYVKQYCVDEGNIAFTVNIPNEHLRSWCDLREEGGSPRRTVSP